jgi:hypothetical protein
MRNKNWLENLKDRPEEERRGIALAVATVFTALILVVWGVNAFVLNSTPNKEANLASATESGKVEEEKGNIDRQWQRIRSGFGVMREELGDLINF